MNIKKGVGIDHHNKSKETRYKINYSDRSVNTATT